ncbi:MAG: hypothetical protein H0X26_09795, partial [Alphaproteobacteria bacterium]|nr:hypothetical protein [Alphaproteobacteria bacterium]
KSPAFFIANRETLFSLKQLSHEETYGGAILYRQKIPPVLDLLNTDTNQEKVIKLTSLFHPKGDEYWTARICLGLEHGLSGEAILETQNNCHQFYKDLYQAFMKFGKAQGIDYLAFTLRIAETYRMTTFENWPFQLGITVANANDGLVHGLLSLKGKGFKSRQCQLLGSPS